MIKELSYEGTEENEQMYTCDDDKVTIAEIDKDELNVEVQINFTAPYKILNQNSYTIKEVGGEWINIELKEVGEYESVEAATFLLQSLEVYDQSVIRDDGLLKVENKLCFEFEYPTVFECDDYWYCKIIGVEPGIEYVSDVENILWFPKRMFTGIAKMLNVMCYFLKEPNYIEKGKKHFVLLREPYSFAAGENKVVVGDTEPTFITDELEYGFAVRFCDENYVELELEGEKYYIDLFVRKSKNKVASEEAAIEDKNNEVQREQKMEQIKENIEMQNEEYIEKQFEEIEEGADKEFDDDLNTLTLLEEQNEEFRTIHSAIYVMYDKYLSCVGDTDEFKKLKSEEAKTGFRQSMVNINKKLGPGYARLNTFEEWDKQNKRELKELAQTGLKNMDLEELKERIENYKEEKLRYQEQCDLKMLHGVLKNKLAIVRETSFVLNNVIEGIDNKYSIDKAFRQSSQNELMKYRNILNTIDLDYDSFENEFEVAPMADGFKYIEVDEDDPEFIDELEEWQVALDNYIETYDEPIKDKIKAEFDEYAQDIKNVDLLGFDIHEKLKYAGLKTMFDNGIITEDELKNAIPTNEQGENIVDLIKEEEPGKSPPDTDTNEENEWAEEEYGDDVQPPDDE